LEEKKPNIVFLMTDQHRWDALGCANPLVITPNLDRLAARGIRFPQAICNVPMCVPSRYSLMTGLYPSLVGVRSNSEMCVRDELLPVPALAERLRDAGYETAGFGKTHWYLNDESSFQPGVEKSTRGFDIRVLAKSADDPGYEPGALMMGEDRPEPYRKLKEETKPFGKGGGTVAGYIGCTSEVQGEHHREGWLTEKALDYLQSGRDAKKPFFLYLSFDFPHAGLNVPPGYEELYELDSIPPLRVPPEGLELPEHARPWSGRLAWRLKSEEEKRRTTLRYYALCTYIDELFGKVLDQLEESEELENTFIVFTSDHGEMLGDRHRYTKFCLYEASVRVPLLMAGPAVAAELRGTVDTRYAELVDVLPTILDAAGIERPSGLSGYSLLQEPVRKGGFAEMHGTDGGAGPAYMWRTDQYKLIIHLPFSSAEAYSRIDEAKGELYDLLEDPDEYHNLYDHADKLALRERLTRDMTMHLACTWAAFPRQYSKKEATV
jgi:arylsulfatase A-like enzyme